MPRGLGQLQREIKQILQRAWDGNFGPLTFATIRAVYVMKPGGDPESDRLAPHFERSLKRALRTLVDRQDVLIVGGKGGQKDPYRYTTVEAFAAVATEGDAQTIDTVTAKSVVLELMEATTGLRKVGA